ncbi:unnamed protein product [marine sediment metagenome]|uniref:Uncharacterized protein n=1 Tax=marine sediment metagenome TaxID=412755 RepID=X1BE16_9ZZZZ
MNVLSEIYYVDGRQKYLDEKEKGILLSEPVDFNNKDIQDKCHVVKRQNIL